MRSFFSLVICCAVLSLLPFGTGCKKAEAKKTPKPASPPPKELAKSESAYLVKGKLKCTITTPDSLERGVNAEITFYPADDGSNCCKNISFLQVVLEMTYGGKPAYPQCGYGTENFKQNIYDYFKQFSTDEKKANYLDHEYGQTHPYYGARWDGTNWVSEMPRQWFVGNGPKKSQAFVIDTPYAGVGRLGKGKFVMRLETAAFCLDTQQVLGAVKWGFEVPDNDDGDMIITGATKADFTMSVSDEFKALVARANTIPAIKLKVGPPNTKDCDCGGTSALP